MTTRQRQEHQTGTYRELIGIAEEVVESARTALRQTRKARGKDMIADLVIVETRKEIEHFCGLGARVIDQSPRDADFRKRNRNEQLEQVRGPEIR
jgi:IS5 family transposase